VTFPQGLWIQVFDGRKGWTRSPFESAAPVPMSWSSCATRLSRRTSTARSSTRRRKGSASRSRGRKRVDGKDVWRIRVTRPDGTVRHLDRDVATSLKVRWEGELGQGPERKVNVSSFSDYRAVNGISFPFRIVSGVAGEKPNQEIVFERIEINPSIPDSAFEAPK
jgi:hypothetical protein